MKKFIGEFKKFITRGNVVDLAVGVIIGGAFTGIVNGLSNYVLKPVINWVLALVLGKDGLSGAVTVLSPVYDETTKLLDLSKSIYIDWGAFISAIINFFIVAFVLFLIVKTINRVQEGNQKLKDELAKFKLSKEDKKELKARGIKRYEKEKIQAYLDEKKALIEKQKEEEARLNEEKAREERLNNPTTEDLLKDIKALLEKTLEK
ncbi:MAG: large conductance mechanosensitive channel protein MscL [Clostridia bacterium]|nr:large conductance mechanosensitive channel protein MscL [Clostridia bacterium]